MRSLISFDLRNGEPEDYRALREILTRLGARWAQRSVWLYEGPLMPHQILSALAPWIDKDDDVMVVELGTRWATLRSAAAEAWLSVRSWFSRLLG